MKKSILCLALLAASASSAYAANSGIGVNVGTLGLGLDYVQPVTPSLNGRLGFDTYSYSHSQSNSGIDYDAKLKLNTVHALADWHPFEGSFRLTGGLMFNNNKLSLSGKPTGGTYTINGNVYNATDVTDLSASIDFKHVSPYFGIGFGNPVANDKAWGFSADIGVLYQGSPRPSLSATCGPAIAGTATCTQLQSDTAAQQSKLANDLSNYKWYPVISLGAYYHFQ